MTAFAFSLITNMCVTDMDSSEEANHEDVVHVGKNRQALLGKIVLKMVLKMNEDVKLKNNNNNNNKV